MAAQIIRSEGIMYVPKDIYMAWLTSLLNVQPGYFVTLGEPRMRDNQIEVQFAEATDFQPGIPVWPPEGGA